MTHKGRLVPKTKSHKAPSRPVEFVSSAPLPDTPVTVDDIFGLCDRLERIEDRLSRIEVCMRGEGPYQSA